MTASVLIRPPENRASNGAQAVNAMFGDKSRLSRRNPVPRQYKKIINWGNSTPLQVPHNDYELYNNPKAVEIAANKLRAFGAMAEAGVRIPTYTTNKEEATGGIWLARTALVGSGGDGIVVVRDGNGMPEAPLYVKYIKKQKEYRAHVVDGEVIFTQMKLRRNGAEQTADQRLIRNYDNGWIFAIQGAELNDDAKQEAVKAVEALGLHFGAVDLIRGKDDGLAYILEVNTAPGIESPTLTAAYKEALSKMVGVTSE